MNYYIIGGKLCVGTPAFSKDCKHVTLYLSGGGTLSYSISLYEQIEQYNTLEAAQRSTNIKKSDGRLHV